jgi:hypothetical protein
VIESAGEWERLQPDDAAALFADFDGPWWIAGGWALDLFLDAETRPHDDVDVALLRRDQAALHRLLKGWDLRYATPEHTLSPRDGQPLALPVHGVWARRSLDPSSPWTFEILLNEHREDRWVYRRDPAISRELDRLGGLRRGIPYLRPRSCSSTSRRTRPGWTNSTSLQSSRTLPSRPDRGWAKRWRGLRHSIRGSSDSSLADLHRRNAGSQLSS